MTITITQPVNTRIGGPERTFQTGTVRMPGEEVDVDGIVAGEEIDGNSNWFKVSNTSNHHIWTGAAANSVTNAQTAPAFQQFVNNCFDGQHVLNVIDYNMLLNIGDGLKGKKGDGITVAILDHAIDKSLTFKNKVIRPFDIDSPADSHGTFIAGIIAGISDILGIAPSVQLIELPLYDKDGYPQEDDIISALLDEIIAFKAPIVVNVSQAGIPIKFKEKFEAISNAIIIAAAGTDNDMTGELFFPASLPNVISVGAVTPGFAINDNPSFNKDLSVVIPAFDYVSYSLNHAFESGTDTSSFAAAVVSGIVALLYSEGQVDSQKKIILQQLLNASQPYSNKNKHQFLNTLNPFE